MARAIDLLGRGQADWPAEAKDIRASVHFNGVAAQIREHCAYGRLVAYLQSSDGRFEAMPAEAWNTHAYQGWFSNFFRAPATVIPRRWHPLADIPECWLFVGRAELEAIVKPLASNSVPESTAEPDSAPSIYHVQSEDIRGRPFLFLGQAIEWIGARGEPIDDVDLAAKWDADERELFDCLDATAQDVQGYAANGPRIYESLPSGIWARMNRGGTNDPAFSPVDDGEEREDGGSVFVGGQRWDGVRLPTSFVLKQWPYRAPDKQRQAVKMSDVKRFEEWLWETITASPEIRTHSKGDLTKQALAMGVSGRQAEAARQRVIDAILSRGVDVSAWRAAGRSPKARG